MESKIKNIIKEQKGITLVALVVTIVILIILAVISINVIFGENGLITRAQEGKKEHEKAEARERLEVVLADAYAEKKVSNEYTEEEFLRDHLDEYIYDQEPEAEVNGEEISLNGYTFELDRSVPELGRFVGQNDNLPPAIRVLNKTTKSINVEIIRAEGVNKFKYSYKKLNEDQFSDVVEKSENLFTFENLDANNIYVLKVEMEKNGEVFTIDKTVTLGEIPKGAIELKSVTWENGEASIVIITKENNYQIEWQVNGIEDSKWTEESEGEKEVTINGLRHNSMVYVRLFDGVSSGEYASISVKDVIKPQNANIVINSENIILKQTIEATITHLDNESDVSIQESKWVCNTKSNKIGTNPDLYTGGVSKQNPEKISFVLPQLGEYYLHVLTVDNAGNKTETVFEPIVPLQFTYSIDLSNQNLKMNPEDCFVNDKTDMSEDEKLILNKINKDISGTYERIFTEENNKEYIALVKNNTEVYKNYFMYDKNSIKKVTKYKDSGWILYDSDPQGWSAEYSWAFPSFSINSSNGTFSLTGTKQLASKISNAYATSPRPFYSSQSVPSSSKVIYKLVNCSTTHVCDAIYKRQFTTVTENQKGSFIENILLDSSYPVNGVKGTFWYNKTGTANKYIMYQYDQNLRLNCIYDTEDKTVQTTEIKLNTPKDYILIKANSQDSKYIVEISADNNKWQNIGSDLNEVKRIDIQGVTDKIYLKITLNDSKIEGIEIYE